MRTLKHIDKAVPSLSCLEVLRHREVHDPQKDLVDPAVKGTRNVVQAAVKSKDTVKRIVVTSSFVGVFRCHTGLFSCRFVSQRRLTVKFSSCSCCEVTERAPERESLHGRGLE